MTIQKVAVIGSGVMGSAIAAHLANAGVPSYLFDIVPRELGDDDKAAGLNEQSPRFRNKLAIKALEQVLPSLKPSPTYEPKVLKLITPANLADDLAKISECDWIVEVVVERLDIKRSVYSAIEGNLKSGAIISSNTSGIPLSELTDGRSDAFRKNFLITHFFNPVRYMKLVEVVQGSETDAKQVARISEFLSDTLGKGVVNAKDSPCFIANRIGVFAFMNVFHHALEQGLSVEAVDKITGPATGKPKSATFRTGDIVGFDTIAHIVANNAELLKNDERKDMWQLPSIAKKMLEQKWLGDKTGQGFYKKIKTDAGKEILSLDLKTAEYKTQEKVRFDSLGAVKGVDDVGERIKIMINSDDVAGKFSWLTTRDILVYALNRVPEVADDIISVDNAMCWGFNWDIGPFAMVDAIGAADFAERLKKDGVAIPALLRSVLENGGKFLERKNGKVFAYNLASKKLEEVTEKPGRVNLARLKIEKHELKVNDSASLIDLGDGVALVEFHSKMNAIDGDIGNMLNEAIDLVESDKRWQGFVIGNDATNFSVGANLMLLWMESQQGNWDGITTLVKGFQDVVMRLRYSAKPVVAAPAGMTLGGGCEVVLGCDAVRACGETYIGLVEVGAGLIPGGGGNKNLLLNIEANLKASGPTGWAGKSDGGPFPKIQKAFETIGFAKVATSAREGIAFGYMPKSTKISVSREKLLFDAKQDVIELAKTYVPTKPREDILVPGVGGKMALWSAIGGYELQKIISEHDALIAKKLAHVLCGGDLPSQGLVSEQYLLDIEREAFLSLCGEEKSQARMQSLLMSGKPLRN